jgi:hypothetical protein
MSDQSELLHFSLDDVRVSLFAPFGYLAMEESDQVAVLWSSDTEARKIDSKTFEVRWMNAGPGTAVELSVHRMGRTSIWDEWLSVVVDGIQCAGRRFSSNGSGGSMQCFVLFVPTDFPLVIRAEWPRDESAFDEMCAIAESIRILVPFEDVEGKMSSCHEGFRMSVWHPADAIVEMTEVFIRIVIDGGSWVLRPSQDDELPQEKDCGSALKTLGGLEVSMSPGLEGHSARIVHASEVFGVVAEGNNATNLEAITRSLRFHQFIDQ